MFDSIEDACEAVLHGQDEASAELAERGPSVEEGGRVGEKLEAAEDSEKALVEGLGFLAVATLHGCDRLGYSAEELGRGLYDFSALVAS